jgi:hypothetical protein
MPRIWNKDKNKENEQAQEEAKEEKGITSSEDKQVQIVTERQLTDYKLEVLDYKMNKMIHLEEKILQSLERLEKLAE